MLSEHEGEGVRISSVIEGTKAEEAGLLPGDILISINGISYDNVGEFVRELGTHEPGEFVLLEYLRLGNKEEMEVELGEKAVSSYEKQLFLSPENLDFPNFNGDINIFEFSPENGESFQWNSNENSNKAFLGVSPGSNCTDQTKGVPIGQISPNSTAEEMGIKEGDIIEDINGEDVNTFNEIADLIGQMSPGDAIRVSITRDGKKEKLKGELGAKKSTGFDSYIFEGLPPLDNLDFDIQIDGNDSFGEELEIMIQKLEEQDFENLSDEELEFQIQQMLEPMLQNLGQVTESIRIGIVVMDITEEDLDQVNKNAEVGIKTEDDLDLEFINYFPNPLTSSLNLNFQLASEAPYKVLVYDQTGRTVFEDYRSITGEYANTIDLTGLASGPYFLQIVQGDNSYGRKLVKE